MTARGPEYPERDAEIARRRAAPNPDTLQDIADDYGISRERVRQIAAREGVDMEAAAAAARPSHAERVCAREGCETVIRGRPSVVSRQRYCSRECAHEARWPSDREVLAGYERLAVRLGHVPTVGDVTADPDVASQGTFQSRFGGMNAVRRLCGLPEIGVGSHPAPSIPDGWTPRHVEGP